MAMVPRGSGLAAIVTQQRRLHSFCMAVFFCMPFYLPCSFVDIPFPWSALYPFVEFNSSSPLMYGLHKFSFCNNSDGCVSSDRVYPFKHVPCDLRLDPDMCMDFGSGYQTEAASVQHPFVASTHVLR